MIPNELTSDEAVEQAVAWALANGWSVEPHRQRPTSFVCDPCAATDATCVVFRKAGHSDQWYRLAWWVRARFIWLTAEVAG